MMTERELEIRHWLNRAFHADKKAKALEMLVEQCRERAEGLSRAGGCNDTTKSATPKNGTEEALKRLEEMEELYVSQMTDLLKISDEVKDAIKKLDDIDLETVLIHRYILFHTIEETAELMHYSPETIKRKHRQAIKKLTPFDLV